MPPRWPAHAPAARLPATGSKRSEVEAALHGADAFFGSLLFDFDAVEWLRPRLAAIPVRLVFESSLELMAETQVGSFKVSAARHFFFSVAGEAAAAPLSWQPGAAEEPNPGPPLGADSQLVRAGRFACAGFLLWPHLRSRGT
jgi:hypothetical protein